jgi:hypothetical protein
MVHGVETYTPFKECKPSYCRYGKMTPDSFNCTDSHGEKISCTTGLSLKILSFPEPNPAFGSISIQFLGNGLEYQQSEECLKSIFLIILLYLKYI